MNNAYRLVWSLVTNAWRVAPECASRRATGNGRHRRIVSSLPLLVLPLAASLQAAELPSGEEVVGGEADIERQGDDLTVEQSSHRAAIEWERFSIGKGKTVRFKQPGSDAAALNRVTGDQVSEIRGALEANGRVFLVNPSGVTFSPSARVDVGALVASTLDISTEDFMNGNYRFEGDSANAVVNQGNITTAEGGTVAMIAAEIVNTGTIETPQGNTLMGAGSTVTLDLGGPVQIEVEEARLDTVIEQGGAIRADGGRVLLTAKAADELTASVINHSGITEAKTLASGENGEIKLMGDMDSGRVEVAGRLDASAPEGGDGGFVDTSAAKVSIANEVQVTTRANSGETGEWLIDPTDFTVSDGTDSQSDSGIGAETLSSNLANNDVTLETVSTGSEDGDINVNAAVDWDADTTLTLDAHGDINVNAALTATGDSAGLALNYDDSDYHLNAPVTLSGNNASLSVNGTSYTLIQNVDDLQAMSDDLGGHYALGQDIDASATSGWNGGAGFVPVGDKTDNFTGTFDGLGHTIQRLYIARDDDPSVGLFGFAFGPQTLVRNVGLAHVDITGRYYVGGLVGYNTADSHIENAYVSGDVSGSNTVGGLVGINDASIRNAYSMARVEGLGAGGLVGSNGGSIDHAYATGAVTGSGSGGLVGINNIGGNVTESYYATTDADGNDINTSNDSNQGVGVRYTQMANPDTFSDWDSSASWAFSTNAGVPGYQVSLPYLEGVTRQQDLQTTTLFEDGTGTSSDPFTLTDWQQLHNIKRNADVLTGGYHFDLINDLDSGTSGYADLASPIANGDKGWGPIGDYDNSFTGTLDGLGHVISDLTIDRGNQSDVGLFGYIEDATLRQIGLENVDITGENAVGSLVGNNYGGTISQSYATGSVSGAHDVGGLVGDNSGTISQSYATSDVSGKSIAIGGLVGHDRSGTISQSYATGTVTGISDYVGGLVGIGYLSTIHQSYATGDVNGYAKVGGLLGVNDYGSISQSYATGSVSGTGKVGGLAGKNRDGDINNTYATGRVSGTGDDVGGLVGYNNDVGTISQSYATGDVSTPSAVKRVGGLVGNNSGTVTDSYYATTDAEGNAIDGGYTNSVGTPRTRLELMNPSTFEGWDEAIWNFGGDADVEGYQVALPWLDDVAPAAERVTDTLFLDGTGTSSDPYILTDWQQLQNVNFNDDVLGGGYHFDLANNLGSGTSGYADLAGENANDGKGWEPIGDDATPFTGTFDGLDHVISELTINRGGEDYIGLFGTATDSSSKIRNVGLLGVQVTGNNSVGGLVGDNNGSITNAYVTGMVRGTDSYYVGGLVGQNDGSITNAYVTGTVKASEYVGGLVGVNWDSIANAYATGVVMGSESVGGLVGYSFNGDITNVYATGAVTGNKDVGGLVGFILSADLSNAYATGTVTGNEGVGGLVGGGTSTSDSYYATTDADGNAIDGGYTNSVGTPRTRLELMNPATFEGWDEAIWNFGGDADVEGYQVALPRLDDVTPTADRVTDTLFQNGIGTSSDPYILTDWQQLQNVNFNGDVLGGGYHFVLANNLDSGTSAYADLADENANGGKGWDPIGDAGSSFIGTFDGRANVIYDLFVDRPSESYVGLFGYAATEDSQIQNLGLNGGQVSGDHDVGGLVGFNAGGNIANTYATTDVTGAGNEIGGLVGTNYGQISGAYASGSVKTTNTSDGDKVGGLVGMNHDAITDAYATGSVAGVNNVGGLVGANRGDLDRVHATGTVMASGNQVAGLAGSNSDATISNAYATGAVSTTANVVGSGNIVGGLVGRNEGSIRDAYATGSVTAEGVGVGGLVGFNTDQGAIHHTYTTGDVEGAGDYLGGLTGRNDGSTNVSFYATTDTDGNAIDGDYTNSVGSGQSYAKLTQLDTFAAWGDDIDDQGSTDAVWRLYEGNTTPLLRSFLTPVSVSPDGSGLSGHTYDGNTATGSTDHATNVNGAALDGHLNYRTGAADAGHYRTRDGSLVLSGLYSGQQGYDISYDEASLTIERRPVVVTADDQRKAEGSVDPTFTWQAGCGALTSGCGLVAGENLDGALIRDQGDAPGNYAIRQGSVNDATNPNYAIDFVSGRLDIAEANAGPQPGDTLFPLPARSTITALQQPGSDDETDHVDADEDLMLQAVDNEIPRTANAVGVDLPRIRVEDGGIALPAVQDEPTAGGQ
ncbi:GLUG motif-containing protein [Aidingimonas lacisalsi]|uniref:GLUG motif-containing protein n=1 Tax=Aidingimonas lacisalsi TaxID=2604086 RepID=UPI0013761565|nr:GLUG motif-containing protein [Aidingimonas lacisalsi]